MENCKAILVGVDLLNDSFWTAQQSLTELSSLVLTAGLSVQSTVLQKMTDIHPLSYVGKGKLHEIKDLVDSLNIVVFVADDELSPRQQKFLESFLNIKILDRTSLILDIFASRAFSHESQLQIELAQLTYLLPRLRHMWTHLSRLGGQIGTRGPGETQLEVDRRQVGRKIDIIKKRLTKLEKQRQLRRSKRQDSSLLNGAIVGYTNAGKSTLMRQLTHADVLVEDKLFATLDPLTRRFKLEGCQDVTLTDTVGFIQKLPHHLVQAFHSTLDEVKYADFLVHVIDVSHEHVLGVLRTSQTLIDSLLEKPIPIFYVFNKCDRHVKLNFLKEKFSSFQPQIFVSALDSGVVSLFHDGLLKMLRGFTRVYEFKLSYSCMDLVDLFYKYGVVNDIDFSDYIYIKVDMSPVNAEKIMAMLPKG